jgi:hypothetical protein
MLDHFSHPDLAVIYLPWAVAALLPLVRPSLCVLLLLAPAQLHLPRGDRVTRRGTYSCHVHHPQPCDATALTLALPPSLLCSAEATVRVAHQDEQADAHDISFQRDETHEATRKKGVAAAAGGGGSAAARAPQPLPAAAANT